MLTAWTQWYYYWLHSCSTLAGVCFPLLLLIYGFAFTQFANYAVTIQLEKDNLAK